MGRSTEGASMLSFKPGGDFNFQEKDPASSRVWGWLVVSVLLGISLVLCAIFYVWLYIQQVQNGYRLAKIYEENELHSTVHRKLKLEWSRFRDPYRLEEIGRNQFGLAPPRPDQKVLMR
ncbi:MAG: cell division protein FtsL [Syntrophobacter sp.]